MRLVPQVTLLDGYRKQIRYGFAPVFVQIVFPLLFIVIVAINVCPVVTPVGTLQLTNVASSAGGITSVEIRVFVVPLKTSWSRFADETPGMVPVEVYCQTFHVPQTL